ncbi:hypothetical protein FACS189472_07970 [Alphaproteobacteria bacterium]|nr:hypothetical protein FACS189472_07970 [Alphaproteobacteria bacterium]
MFVADPEKLTNSKTCQICLSQWFDMRDKKHWKRNYDRHVEMCKAGNGEIGKQIKLDKKPQPFVPHLRQAPQPTTVFATYDFETCEIAVNKKMGCKKEIVGELLPISVAVCSSLGHKRFFCIKKSMYFVNEMLEYLFNLAKSLKLTKKEYLNVLGFNSGKFDFVLLLPYLQGKNWYIEKDTFIGTASVCKQIIVRHVDGETRIRFLDLSLYAPNNSLKKFVETFGNPENMDKGLFPYDLLRAPCKERAREGLDKIPSNKEPFTQESFFDSLKNEEMSDKNYGIYLKDYEAYKNMWEYLEYYKVRDVEVMIEPINKMINMFSQLGVDILSYLSLSANASSIKHKMLYDGFDVEADYNCESDEEEFVSTIEWATERGEGYTEQDKKAGRSAKDNVTASLIMALRNKYKKCYLCKCKFTENNKSTLDRIDNSIGHTLLNVKVACRPCNIFKSDRDAESVKLRVQTRLFALKYNLPMTITDKKIYRILRDGITGGLANVGHRYNIRAAFHIWKKIKGLLFS